MIRINLLPGRREPSPRTGQGWLLGVLVAGVIVAVGLALFHQVKVNQLKRFRLANTEMERQIAASRSEVKQHPELKKKLELQRSREQAIVSLQQARSGPTHVLLELSRILTRGRGPTISREQTAQIYRDSPQDLPNPAWDPRRLWLVAFREKDRSAKMEGLAHDAEDVSELARRLSASPYFSDVVLLPAKQHLDSATKANLVSFQLEAKVRY